ncbi:mitochondrial intermediate peptidase [Neocloeon triangulifer]|uniref:mitochondrial intermediate peptidase n=1 Tax=Neocloeon triangulifer TaxID=2078957 RepID=UPI00286EDBCA|nr:mitochondrial intermediate peptidase [Neocloeon triangulifer]
MSLLRGLLASRHLTAVPFKRKVTTWSNLATAFNSKPEHRINFGITKNDAGLFGVPELRSADGFYLLQQQAEYETEKLIEETGSKTRQRAMVKVFDEMSDCLCRVADLAEFVRIAHPKASYTQAAENACIAISGIVERLNTHPELYHRLKSVLGNKDIVPTSALDDHVAELFLFDFEQSGIHLSESERQKVVNLNNSILQYGQRFMTGCISPRSVPKSEFPTSTRHLFMADGENLIVTGLYADSGSDLARQTAYKMFLQPDELQEYFLSEMLTNRHELAKLCGFPTYAHRALKSSTAETPQMVSEFLDQLSSELKPRAEQDFLSMQRLKIAENPESKSLAAWDVPYLTHKVKKAWLQLGTGAEFAPYLSLGACMEGLDNLIHSLYNIRLVNAEMEFGESWSPEVYKLAVVHNDEGLLGHIYCDFYERTNKPNQDCHFTIRGGKQLPDGTYQNPIVVLMLSLPTPRWSSPSLLSPSMVDNLFHEMGHALHSMLARTKYQHVTGTRCATDFAEVPSVLMEYFAADPRVIRSFARHYQTHEPIPDAMLARLCASKNVFAASEMQLQVFYSALDQMYHGHHPLPGKDTTEILKMVQEKHYGLPYVDNTAWQLRFSHLVGYGAKYYSYLLSRAIASWIWQQYFEENPFCSDAGERFRRECLAHGGGLPPRQLVAAALGRQVTPQQLASALVRDLEARDKIVNQVVNKCL